MTRPAGGPATLTIVVPAYNEEKRLERLLSSLTRDADRVVSEAGHRLAEVIVVDDGSTDLTPEVLKAFDGLDGRLRVLRLPRNAGKGAAVRAGMLATAADVALLTDVDLSTPLDDLPALAAVLSDGADMAMGSRALAASDVAVAQPVYRELMGKAFNLALRLLTGLPYRDTQCGFKLFRLEPTRPLFEEQRVAGFAFDAEICLRARQRGLVIVEVPVRWRNDPATHVTLVRSSARMALDLLKLAWLARRLRKAA